MVRINKLVHYRHFSQFIAAGKQNIRVTDKAVRITGNGNYFSRTVGFGQRRKLRGLRFGSGTRRIKYDGSKTLQFRGIQRIFKQDFDGCFNIGNHILID